MVDKTIEIFKEITQIPRESGNEEEIADYICEFAKKRKLEYKKDKWNNVLIKKKTCNKPPIILQAHIDMVCEKLPEKKFDFEKDSIEIIEENGYLRANGTTLGADNGIGVAQILTILDSNLPCNVEAVFTVSEETSMIGAINFDTTELKGKQLLNLDGFEENTIIIESACFYDIVLKSKYRLKEENTESEYLISIEGLPGGHSGFEIDKNRGNSCIELAKILEQIGEYRLNNFVAGTKFNVIPSNGFAIFCTEQPLEEISKICREAEQKLELQYPNAQIKVKKQNTIRKILNEKESKHFIRTILEFPHGVLYQNEKNEVTTSINLAVVDLQNNEIKVGMRSSKKQEEKQCINIIERYCEKQTLQFNILGTQPGFESNQNSKIIQNLLNSQPTKLFIKPVEMKSMHITVEVGFFQKKIPDLEIAIISPTITGAHTIQECVEIASIERTTEWIYKFLEL